MAFTATLTADSTTFTIDDGETVLDAALRAGVPLDYGCRHGNCSKCKYFLEEGDVDFGQASIYSLSDEEREEGFGLMCCAKPLTDLVIESRGLDDPRAKPHLVPAGAAAEVSAVTALTPTLWQLDLELDRPLTFYPGQFAELQLAGSEAWRSYSIASAPANGQRLQFVIKHVAGGEFSGRVPTLEPGTAVAVRGPYGTSYLRDGGEDVLLVATGSGISPILSILRHAAENDDPRRFSLYYGARTAADIPLPAYLGELEERFGGRFAALPALSRAGDDWPGFHGRVTQALQRELPDASRLDAYVCGAPDMCDTVGTLLEAKGIAEGHLFYDKFHPAVGT